MSKTDEQTIGMDLANVAPNVVDMMERLDIKMSDPDMFTVMIAERLSLAETVESLDQIANETSVENHLGEPFYVRRVHYLPAGFDQALPFYAVVEAVHAETGEYTVWSTGSTGVVISLARRAQKGWLDKPVRVMRAERATANGYYPLNLVTA